MHKKYPVVIHAVLLLFCLLFLFGMFVERTDTGGVIDSRRVQPTCQEINYTEMVEENDPDAPVGVTRIFHFQLNSDLAGKQLMFYVINANTRVYIQGKRVYDWSRNTSNPVSGTGCYWVNLPLIRADSGKEVVVEIQPIYRATVDRTITFYEGVRYPLFWKLFRHDALFLLIGVLLVIFGIFYLLIGVYYRMKMQSALYLSPLGMVAVLVGLWKIADTRLITWLIPGHALFFSYLSMFSIMFAPFFVALYIHMSARKTGSIRKVTSVLLVVNAVLVLAAFAAHLLRLLALRESQELYNYCILVQALFLLVFEICIYPKHKDDMRHRLFLLSMILLMAMGTLDILHFLLVRSSNSLFFIMIGVLVYIIAVGVFTMRGTQDKLFRDKATGLYNRNKCNELIHTGVISDKHLCFMMFDLNGLKKTNDNFGHDAGDQMIESFAAVLRRCIPAGNFIGRSGGDEFVGIIYNTDETRVKQIISNIREQIESFNQAEDRGWQLGTAVGYAFAEEAPDRSYTTLYELADQRMYENKRAMKAART